MPLTREQYTHIEIIASRMNDNPRLGADMLHALDDNPELVAAIWKVARAMGDQKPYATKVAHMDQEKTYTINDTYRAIASIAEQLRAFESERVDPRVKAMILTKLQEARLLCLELIVDA